MPFRFSDLIYFCFFLILWPIEVMLRNAAKFIQFLMDRLAGKFTNKGD